MQQKGIKMDNYFSNLDFNKVFKVRERKQIEAKRNYDVRITINKAGTERQCIRFGLINKGAEIAKSNNFVWVGDLTESKTKIFFKFFKTKENIDCHKISQGFSGKAYSESTSFCFTHTPKSETKEEKMYRMNWVGKSYSLKYNEEYDVYYIENE